MKLADLIDNCADICGHNRGFGRIFLEEMRRLLEVLTRADPKLLERAWATHDEWAGRLAVKPRQDRIPPTNLEET